MTTDNRPADAIRRPTDNAINDAIRRAADNATTDVVAAAIGRAIVAGYGNRATDSSVRAALLRGI